MAIRNIVQIGDSILNKKCREVTEFNGRLYQLLEDMQETLVEAGGLGLAAPQVGVLRAVCIVAEEIVSEENEEVEETLRYYELINPKIINEEGAVTIYEGCLSIPGRNGAIERPEKITFTAQNRKGELYEMEATGLFARAVCHELDHLNGVTILELTDDFMEDHVDESVEAQLGGH